MTTTQGIRMKAPAHPGGFIGSEIIEPLGLTVTKAAEALGVTRAALSALLNERANLSPEMALRIRKGVRRVHGHAHAHAEQFRYCANAEARGGHRRPPYAGAPSKNMG